MLRGIARENGDGILVGRFWILTCARRQSERDQWEKELSYRQRV
jgi:hypothetical protein